MNRTGEQYVTKYNEKIQIINYINAEKNDVLFLDYNWVEKDVSFDSIKKGSVRCPYTPTIYNIGFLGEDFYKYRNIKDLQQYIIWRNMMKRCYCESAIKINKSYGKVSVCKEWYNFTTFYKWYNENYYIVPNQKMCLDKDIRVKGANLYSKDTCIFVPEKINLIFERMNKQKRKDSGLPLGVRWIKADKIYGAACRIGEESPLWLGRSHSVEECFNRYKKCKEGYIKQVANEFKEYMPTYVYDIIINYNIEITD